MGTENETLGGIFRGILVNLGTVPYPLLYRPGTFESMMIFLCPFGGIQLMEEILHHLGCIKPCK